jgi:hypothetical protein
MTEGDVVFPLEPLRRTGRLRAGSARSSIATESAAGSGDDPERGSDPATWVGSPVGAEGDVGGEGASGGGLVGAAGGGALTGAMGRLGGSGAVVVVRAAADRGGIGTNSPGFQVCG